MLHAHCHYYVLALCVCAHARTRARTSLSAFHKFSMCHVFVLLQLLQSFVVAIFLWCHPRTTWHLRLWWLSSLSFNISIVSHVCVRFCDKSSTSMAFIASISEPCQRFFFTFKRCEWAGVNEDRNGKHARKNATKTFIRLQSEMNANQPSPALPNPNRTLHNPIPASKQNNECVKC